MDTMKNLLSKLNYVFPGYALAKQCLTLRKHCSQMKEAFDAQMDAERGRASEIVKNLQQERIDLTAQLKEARNFRADHSRYEVQKLNQMIITQNASIKELRRQLKIAQDAVTFYPPNTPIPDQLKEVNPIIIPRSKE